MSTFVQKVVAIFSAMSILITVLLLQRSVDFNENEADRIAYWVFDKLSSDGKTISDTKSAIPISVRGNPKIITTPTNAIELNGSESLTIQAKQPGTDPNLPKEAITISSWVRIDQGEKYGGILGLIQDNGDYEKGFILGYDETRFYFALAGNNSKESKLTYMKSRCSYELGRWYHVVGTYDGKTMRIYINGQEENSSNEQSGTIAYPPTAPFVAGCYKDDDEYFPMIGAIKEIQLYKRALDVKEVGALFQKEKELPNVPSPPAPLKFVIEPYLQYPTRESITILWETPTPSDSTIFFGPSDQNLQKVYQEEKVTIHEVVLKDLKPNTKYVYKVISTDAEGKTIPGELRQFMTAVDEDSAYSFAIIGDTQKNPKMTEKIAKLMFERRPHFVMHLGDVVDNGPDKKEWENELFKPCAALFSRVAVFPTIGNHEKNHAHYYRYFSLPKPEYFYKYTYGNAEFFSIDTNKPVKPDSEQYKWLDAELGKSKAKWKFVYHHHPAWSSDEDDFGNTWKGPSRMGDLNVRNLIQLYEKHNVDIVFNGHIHLYERTWPLRDNKVNKENGVIYITSGGGGGKLEKFGPLPTWFKAQGLFDFHYCYVSIHGNRFELKAYDQNGILFDFLNLQK